MPIKTIRQVPTREKVVALTFDDGPHPEYTPRAIKTLQQHNGRATWFILGSQAHNRLDILREIYRSGNDIGVHSYDHIRLTNLSSNQAVGQISRTRALIEQATGQFWSLFRPPYGLYNNTVLAAASSLGFNWNVLWSVDPRDYNSSVEQIITRVLSGILPGAIILLHEVTLRTTQALPVILQEISNRGYRAVSLSSLLESEPVGPSQCRSLIVVRPYMRGDDVLAVQGALQACGLNPGPIDGIYGPQTAAAVVIFQAGGGLPATGNVDRQTYSALKVRCP